MDNIPIEIFELVFQKLDIQSLKKCRLVCSSWNHEIKSHIHLGLIVNDKKAGNLEFIKKINLPTSLRILEFDLKNSKVIATEKSARVENLSFKFSYTSQPKICLKTFGNACYMLTCLKLHRPVLGTCDLQDESLGCILPRSIFMNLNKLSIYHIDDYWRKCDGQIIRRTSKNISFLLEVIGSTSLTKLSLYMNSTYCDVNSSIARQDYRFEDYILPQFICRQKGLEELYLDVPISLPQTWWKPFEPFPTCLKYIDIRNRIGNTGVFGANDQIILYPDLLQWDETIYANLDRLDQSAFWREFLLSQTRLECLIFNHLAEFGSADFVSHLVHKNRSTLKTIILETMLTGTINGSLMQDSCLENLYVCGYLGNQGQLFPNGQGDCILIHLPTTLTTLNLINVHLELEEAAQIVNMSSLRRFQILYDYQHYAQLPDEPDFIEIIRLLLTITHLDELMVGYVEYQVSQMFGLEEWFDQDSSIIIIP